MEPILCYEVVSVVVGSPNDLIGAYWNVREAWAVAQGVGKTNPDLDIQVLVTWGTEIDVTTNRRSVRTDVIGNPPEVKL